jgi:hypothetical protein
MVKNFLEEGSLAIDFLSTPALAENIATNNRSKA